MDTKDILKATQSTQRLIQDQDYYKYIFKKTERIVSVVFYITNSLDNADRYKSHIDDIEHAARHVHDAVLQSLEARAHTAEDAVRATAHALITLESKLRIAQVAGLIAPAVLEVFTSEVDTVLRGTNRYTGQEEQSFAGALDEMPARTSDTPERSPSARAAAPMRAASDTNILVPQKQSRQARIATVIEARGEASIKDISEVITDVSEKTIQRELNVMIDKNIIKRQGERRWSRYSLFSKD